MSRGEKKQKPILLLEKIHKSPSPISHPWPWPSPYENHHPCEKQRLPPRPFSLFTPAAAFTTFHPSVSHPNITKSNPQHGNKVIRRKRNKGEKKTQLSQTPINVNFPSLQDEDITSKIHGYRPTDIKREEIKELCNTNTLILLKARNRLTKSLFKV